MYIDASVIVAILNHEQDANTYKQILDKNRGLGIVSAITIYEASVSLARAKTVLLGRKPIQEEIKAALKVVNLFVAVNAIKQTSISPEIGNKAVEVAAIYGKIVGHPADLNFGDCFAYACAKAESVTLLFKGNDFTKTDLRKMD